ncbi:MAG: hypothetical protein M1834_009324 [Cirrosporium novae-zelandiae]|nr:MAG: hypothetical protein M1834_009324 [Cirrosporium novae-zelandiae]
MTDKKIAIIGGGLGGMSFANAALYHNLTNIALYEQAPQFSEVGAGVNISSNALRILDAYGLKDSMTRRSSHDPPCWMDYRHYKTGEFLGQIDELGEPTSRQIHRAHLLDTLKERVPSSAIHTGKKLINMRSLESSGGGYELQFADGTTANADLVVGCDGIKSKVRQYMGITDHPDYSGQCVYRGFVQYEHLPSATAALLRKTVNFRGPRRHVLTLPVGNEESNTAQVGIIVFVTESLDSWKSESWMARASIGSLEAHLDGWCQEVQDILEGLKRGSGDGMVLKQTLYVRSPVEKWFEVQETHPECGVVLVGDSVHSTLPHQGQGTCMAIESGACLARILSHFFSHSPSPSLHAPLSLYKSIRKPRTDRQTLTSFQTGKLASAEIMEGEEESGIGIDSEALRERMRWLMEYDLFRDVDERVGGGGEARL